MLSGIGDKSQLKVLNISILVDSPDVGQNVQVSHRLFPLFAQVHNSVQDHAFLPSSWAVNSTDTLDTLQRNDTLLQDALERWQASRTGPLVLTASSQFGWLRLPKNATIFQSEPDPSAGNKSAHFEMIFSASKISWVARRA